MSHDAVTKTLRFESLSKQRIQAILEIEKQSNTLPWSERSFLNELENPQSIFLVAIVDGLVAGYAGVWTCIDEAHITTLAIAPINRRSGLGTRVMREILRRSAEAGMVCATLEVRSSNEPAIALYESLGFASVTRRKRYYPDNQEDAIVMWLHDLNVKRFS